MANTSHDVASAALMTAFWGPLTPAERTALAIGVEKVTSSGQNLRRGRPTADSPHASSSHPFSSTPARSSLQNVQHALLALEALVQDAVAAVSGMTEVEQPPTYEMAMEVHEQHHNMRRRGTIGNAPAAPSLSNTAETDILFCPWFAVRTVMLPSVQDRSDGFVVKKHHNPTYTYVTRVHSQSLMQLGLRAGDVLLEVGKLGFDLIKRLNLRHVFPQLLVHPFVLRL